MGTVGAVREGLNSLPMRYMLLGKQQLKMGWGASKNKGTRLGFGCLF